MVPATKFTQPVAVNAWDQWFRWRTADVLCDRTIDRTWWRVANAVAPGDGNGTSWAHRYVEALSHWQLLPDERLLRNAGTGTAPDATGPLSAALNVSAYVLAPGTPRARFDAPLFSEVAALAVRFLDDALLAAGAAPTDAGLRIGLIGFGDALQLLGIAYDDARAAAQARAVGKALASGAVRGATDLARERGAIDGNVADLAAVCAARELPAPLVEDVQRHGVRHVRLTAIQRQPRLALLANNASDALDPQPRIAPRKSEWTSDADGTPPAAAMQAGQLVIRSAIQPWIDAPIDYPLATPETLTGMQEQD